MYMHVRTFVSEFNSPPPSQHCCVCMYVCVTCIYTYMFVFVHLYLPLSFCRYQEHRVGGSMGGWRGGGSDAVLPPSESAAGPQVSAFLLVKLTAKVPSELLYQSLLILPTPAVVRPVLKQESSRNL